ncbi:MAG TPA: ATP-grasp domain-containing protein, partial [Solirubrobacterales bacterium]|nr:ATP-grasp domain-containing protein [Solirubrobacterales bacterium]
MDLLEYQGKQLFAGAGVAVPAGEPAASVDEAVAAAERIGFPCVIKAQVLIGGRGKAGGIKVAKDVDEARTHADAILGMDISGPRGEGPFRVHQVWVEEASEIDAEYYASIILDRSAKMPLVILSRMGGMNVEEIAEKDPDALVRLHVDPLAGITGDDAVALAVDAGIDEDVVDGVAETLVKLYAAFDDNDATLIEVNPLIVTAGREVVALDAKVTIDGSALFRHEELAAIQDPPEDPQER